MYVNVSIDTDKSVVRIRPHIFLEERGGIPLTIQRHRCAAQTVQLQSSAARLIFWHAHPHVPGEASASFVAGTITVQNVGQR